MKLIRWVLGRIILFFDWAFTPKSIERHPSEQAIIDAESRKLSLYQYQACPFCVKVRRGLKRHGVAVNIHDAKGAAAKTELLACGGEIKVPCLKIERDDGDVEWLYESQNIINYIEARFAPGASVQQTQVH